MSTKQPAIIGCVADTMDGVGWLYLRESVQAIVTELSSFFCSTSMSSNCFTKKHAATYRAGSHCLFVVVLLSLCIATQWSADAQVVDEEQKVQQESPSVQQTESANPAADRDIERYGKTIKPLIEEACFDCHSGESVEGNFHADQLDPDLVNADDIAWWLEVYAVLSKGEMPPPDSTELAGADRGLIVDWLSAEIQAAEKLREAGRKHSTFRRLTRYEYNYALQDLLGVPWTFAGDLPAEASEEDAFENNADSLHMSVQQLETYHELALKALERVTVRGEQPPEVHWSISMKTAFEREKKRHNREIESAKKELKDKPDELAEQIESLRKQFQVAARKTHYLELSTDQRAKVEWEYRKAKYVFEPNDSYRPMPKPGQHFAVVQPGSRQGLTIDLGDRLPNEGTMRVRIRASRAEGVEKRIPSLQLSYGFQATDQGRSRKRVSQQDVQIEASWGQPEIYEWNIPLGEIEHRNTYRGEFELGEQPNPSEYILFTNSTIANDGKDVESPAILIDHIEVAAPVYDQWPPRSHLGVFPENDFKNENSDDESASNEAAYAKEIITAFMARAWRRSPTTADIDRKLQVFQRLRSSSEDFQEAIVEVLATILTSPKFLYVQSGEPGSQHESEKTQAQTTGKLSQHELSQHELATRLSLFLWCSLPDESLRELAAAGRLDEKEVQQQVNRMLADPRATRFNRHFVQQWLKMQPLEFLRPTKGKDGLDIALLESMKEEPIALFAHMLQQDSSVLEFIDSDYSVVNERLAQHYGIKGVQGNQFRRVPVPDELDRGGLLTQAGLLMMNSDGKDSHPVKRGVWLLTNLLNDPPPPPPAAVPEIDLSDPEIVKMTLKERIEDHRNQAACLSCHQKIDPWGIAFENYDALGRRRELIGEKVVDATSVLPDKSKLDGIKGLKEHLIQERQEQFVRATVEKMASFALGRQLGFGDRAAVAKVTRRVREEGDGVKSLVMCLVTSELFRTK